MDAEEPSNGSGQEEEQDQDDEESDDEEVSHEESGEESGIEDDQTGYLRELRDQLLEERQRTLELAETWEAKTAERLRQMESIATRIMPAYSAALRLDPGPAATVITADEGAGVEEFGGGVGVGHDQLDHVQDELEGFEGWRGSTLLARAMARARRSPFYAPEFQRYQQRYPGLSQLVLHVFTFVSTMEFHGLAPNGMPPKPALA